MPSGFGETFSGQRHQLPASAPSQGQLVLQRARLRAEGDIARMNAQSEALRREAEELRSEGTSDPATMDNSL